MFAEELASNASRKRAEANRARRLQIKKQQEKNAASVNTFATVPIPLTNVQPAVTTTPTAVATPGGATLSAVAKAAQLREQRAKEAAQLKAIIKIQSFLRMILSNLKIGLETNSILSSRLQDLQTVRNLVQANNNTAYIPPPATSSMLVQHLWFLSTKVELFSASRTIRSSPDWALWRRVVDLAITPGTLVEDENVNPFVAWKDTREGKYRIAFLIRLAVLAILSPLSGEADLSSAHTLLRSLLQQSCSQPVKQYCRTRLLSFTTSTIEWVKESIPPLRRLNATLDLISILRYYLLFEICGNKPIPDSAEDLRDKCISPDRQHRSGVLLTLILEVTDDSKILSARIVHEIFTIPLLIWKVSSQVITLLASSSENTTPRLLALVHSFIEIHCSTIRNGDLLNLLWLPDVPLKLCPVTADQCLLSNLVQFEILCPALWDSKQIIYWTAADYFDLLSVLLDSVPLSTFSSRETAVEWIVDKGGQHTPIVLSRVVLDQCRVLLLDSNVRRLFAAAIDVEALQIEKVLLTKTDKDFKHEKELTESGETSATALAAKEARIDRSRNIWNTSKWAKKLSISVSSFLGNESDKKAQAQGQGRVLSDTSSLSRKLAGGQDTHSVQGMESSHYNIGKGPNYDPCFLFALCRTFATVLSRWGGSGRDDLIKNSIAESRKGQQERATSKPELYTVSLLNVMCFSTQLTKAAWALLQSDNGTILDIHGLVDSEKGSVPIRSLRIESSMDSKGSTSVQKETNGAALLYLFATTLSHTLVITDDTEFYDMERPIPLHQIRRCIQLFKKLLYRACCVDDAADLFKSEHFGLSLIAASSRLMRDLYDRSSRRPLCAPKLWIVSELMDKEIKRCKTYNEYAFLLSRPVFRVCPFLVSFKRRLQLFERIITTIRIEIQGENSSNPFHSNPLKAGIPIRITRGRILEDGLATMNHLGTNMRKRIAVHYVNEAGVAETGIDAGGLFKEFWTDLSAVAFNPNYALFRVTDGAGNCMYPNPSSAAAHGPDHVVLFEFLGRILGKALYEGITIHPRFAHFFLSFMRGDYNYLHMLPDLSSIDPQLYSNLMFLKNYDGDAQDLCLTFTVTNDDFGDNREIPLVPGGANLEVTNANKHRYVGLVAKYYVVDRIKDQAQAFTRGLWDVIERPWLRLFNEPELQILISGPTDGKIDVVDMRAHTQYAGGFTGIDRTIGRFWNVVCSFNSKQQADLLRFVTSCERPPPLGFASMNPPFTIQRVGIMRDGDKLPSASTCFNILKLPTYSSEKVMRERLLYAIQSGAGFELS